MKHIESKIWILCFLKLFARSILAGDCLSLALHFKIICRSSSPSSTLSVPRFFPITPTSTASCTRGIRRVNRRPMPVLRWSLHFTAFFDHSCSGVSRLTWKRTYFQVSTAYHHGLGESHRLYINREGNQYLRWSDRDAKEVVSFCLRKGY